MGALDNRDGCSLSDSSLNFTLITIKKNGWWLDTIVALPFDFVEILICDDVTRKPCLVVSERVVQHGHEYALFYPTTSLAITPKLLEQPTSTANWGDQTHPLIKRGIQQYY